MKTTRKLFALLMTVVMLLGMIPAAQAQTIWCPDMGWEHKWGPTETIDGSCWGLHFCTVCGAGDEVPLGHKWRETIVEEPWCEVGGMKAMICSVCGEWQNNGTPLEPLGHNWGSWYWVHGYAADCTTGAWQVRDCKRCGTQEDRYIDKTGHKFGEWIVTQEPTCTERGRQHHKCTVCGYSEWEPVDTIGHVFGDWRVIEEPQVGIPGTERRACIYGCGTHEDREIPPLEEALSAEGLELTLVLSSTPANGEYFVVGEEVVFTENWVNNTGKELYPFYVSIWTYPTPVYEGVPDIMGSWDAEETGPVAPGVTGSHQLVTTVTEADVARGAIHAMAIIISNDHTSGAMLEDVTTPFVSAPCVPGEGDPVNSAGVRLEKELRNAPANGEYYVPGEVLNYALTLRLDDGLILDDAAIYDPIVGGDGLVMPGGKGLYGGMGNDVFYVVTEEDAQRGYVENTAYATWIYRDSGEAGRCESETVIAICGTGELPEDYEPTGILQVETFETTTPVNGTHYVEGETVILVDVFTNRSANLTLTGSDWVNVEILGKGIFNRNADFGADAVLTPGESKSLLTSTYVITAEDVAQGYIQKTVHAGFVGNDGMFYTGRFEIRIPCGEGELPDDYETSGVLKVETVATTTPANGSYYVEGETVILVDEFTNLSAAMNLTGSDWVNVEILGKGIFNNNADFGADAVLEPGETKALLTSEYVITAEDVAQGYIQKTVHAGFVGDDGMFYTGSFEIRIPCAPEAETGLIVRKTCITPYAEGTDYFVPGDAITYEITVTNSTGEALYDVEISDPLKGSNEDAIIDRIPEMMVGDSVTVTFTYVPTIEDANPVNGEHILNTASAMGYTVLGEQVNGVSNTVEVALLYLGEVKLSKTVANTPANGLYFVPGETIEFLITVVNDTYYPFYDPILLDPLCEDQYVYDAPNDMSYLCYFDGQLRSDYDNEWAIPVTYVVTEEDAANGSVTNTAEMTYMTFNGVVLFASASATAPCGPADAQPIAVVKGIGNTPANPEGFMFGEVIEFTITVTNNLTETVQHISLVDPLIPGWSYDIYALEPGATVSTTVSYTVNILDCFNGSVENYVSGRAVVSDGYRFLKSNTVSAACMEVTILNAHPVEDPFGVLFGLEVEKTVESLPLNGSFYTEGEIVSYRITYVNGGEIALTDVMIYDALAGIDEIAAAEKLEPGESRTCFFSYTVTAEDVARGYIANVAIGQYDVNGYLNSVHSDVVVVDTDGQPDPEFPEGILPPGGSIDTGALNSNRYCFRSSSERTNVSYSWGTSFCIDHEGIQGTVLMMEKAATTPEALLQVATYAVEMWRTEVEKLYQELLGAADPQARAVIMAEYVAFLTHASNYETLLKVIFADQPEVAAKMLAKLWEEKCITLCFEMHAPVSGRQDSFLSVEVATMEGISDACTCVIRNEDKGWNGIEQTYCPAHGFPFAMIDMLLNGQDTAEAWTTVRQIWQVELRGAYNKMTDVLGEKSDVALAEYATLESWLIAREAELMLLYPENPELVAQTMVRIIIDQVNVLCQMAQ